MTEQLEDDTDTNNRDTSRGSPALCAATDTVSAGEAVNTSRGLDGQDIPTCAHGVDPDMCGDDCVGGLLCEMGTEKVDGFGWSDAATWTKTGEHQDPEGWDGEDLDDDDLDGCLIPALITKPVRVEVQTRTGLLYWEHGTGFGGDEEAVRRAVSLSLDGHTIGEVFFEMVDAETYLPSAVWVLMNEHDTFTA